MSPRRRFTCAVATLGGGRVVAAFVSAVWLVVAARNLSVSAFGDLATMLSIGAIVGVVSDLGYPHLVSAAVADAGAVDASTLRFVVVRRALVGCGVALVGGAAYLVVARHDQVVVPVLFGVSLLTTVVYSSISAALRGLQVYRVEALNEVISRVGVLSVGWVWLASGGGLVAAVAVYAFADTTSLVVLTLIARRHLAADADGIDHHALRLQRNAHFTAGRVFATAYFRSDTWLMALLRNPATAAIYSAPYRLLDGLLLVPRAAGAVAVSQFGRTSDARRVCRIASIASLLTAAVALPTVMFSADIVTALFGARYAASGDVLAVLVVASVPSAMTFVLLPIVSVRAGRLSAHLMGTALVTNVALNLAVIPAYGPVGAASTTLGCQAVLAVILYRVARAQSTLAGSTGAPLIASMRSSATRADAAVSASTTT